MAGMVYDWRGSGFSVPAQEVGEFIEADPARQSPAGLVEASRASDAPTHPIIFGKTDRQLIEDHRMHLARNVLNSLVYIPVKVDASGRRDPRRVFVNVQRVNNGEAYLPAHEGGAPGGVLNDPERRVLAAARQWQHIAGSARTFRDMGLDPAWVEQWDAAWAEVERVAEKLTTHE